MALSLSQLSEQTVQLIKRTVIDDEFSAAATSGADVHGRAENIGEFFLESLDVAVRGGRSPPGCLVLSRCEIRGERLGLAHGQLLFGDPVGGRKLFVGG